MFGISQLRACGSECAHSGLLVSWTTDRQILYQYSCHEVRSVHAAAARAGVSTRRAVPVDHGAVPEQSEKH